MGAARRRRPKLVKAGALLLFCFLLASPAGAQTWTENTAPSPPFPARSAMSATYDHTRDVMTIFGGFGFPHLNDVWTLSGAATTSTPVWTNRTPASPVQARWGHSAVYDAVNNRMVVFGGNTGYSSPAINKVLILANANGVSGAPTWIPVIPLGAPPARRSFHSAVFDPTSNSMIIHGGNNAFTAPSYGDTWALRNASGFDVHGTPAAPTWAQIPTQLTLNGTTYYNSLYINGGAAVYDPTTNQMIVVGGLVCANPPIWGGCYGAQAMDDVWVLSNANGLEPGQPSTWTRVPTDPTPHPTPWATAVSYDQPNDRVYVFGGYDISIPGPVYPDELLWVLTDAMGSAPHWEFVTPTTPAEPETRHSGVMVHHPGLDRLVVFGGTVADGTHMSDVWVLDLAQPEPDLEVTPAALAFGNVDAFTSSDLVVTIGNVGDADLTITEIALTGDAGFAASPLLSTSETAITLSEGSTMNVTITLFPTSVSSYAGSLKIVSDDPDHPSVTVSLLGSGVAGSDEDQAAALEDAVDDAIADGTLVGEGNGNSAQGRLDAFVNMIESAKDKIDSGNGNACGPLRQALRRVDGESPPPDFVSGEAAELLEAQIQFLLDSLGCS